MTKEQKRKKVLKKLVAAEGDAMIMAGPVSKRAKTFRCAKCAKEAVFIPGPTGGGGPPRCDKCGGDLLRVRETQQL